MRKVTCVCVCGDRQVDQLMHGFDVFESFKALAMPLTLELTLKRGCSTAKALADLKVVFEKAGCRVVAVFRPGVKLGAWRDPSVKVISNGQQWSLIEPVLSLYGFKQ